MAAPTQHQKPPRAAGKPPARPAPPPEGLPGWVPPLVYAVLALLLFREFVFGEANLLGIDTLALAYFARDFYTSFIHHFHSFPRWDPYLYGGLPFVEATHGDIFYPPSLALYFLSTSAMWGWKIILHVFLAGVFGYAWLRELGARRTSAFFGGLSYMLGADIVSLVYPGADAKIFVAALAPLAFWLTERAMRRRGLADFAWLGLGVALLMFTSHLQLVYFTVWGISLYALFRLWQIWREERRGALVARLFGFFVLAGVLGVGAASVQFLAPYEYLQTSSRRVQSTLNAPAREAYDYSTSWSMHPEEVLSLLEPDFVGDNAATDVKSGNTYWGRNAVKLNSEYAGLIPLLLAPLVFLRRRRPRDWFFLGLGGLSLLYAVGATTPLFHLFYLIPGVKLFRAPSLIIFLYAISVVTLGAFGFERYLDWARGSDERDRHAARLYLWCAVGVMGLIALLAQAGILLGLWKSVMYSSIPPAKAEVLDAYAPVLQAGCWIMAFLALVLAGVWELLANGLAGWRVGLVGVALLSTVDLYRVDRPFVRATELVDQAPDFATLSAPNDVVGFLSARVQAGEVFRALDLAPMLQQGGGNNLNWMALYGIEQLWGHHPNELGRYRDLIGGEWPTNLDKSNFRLLDLTNTVYLVSPQPIAELHYPVVYQSALGNGVIYRNPNALPRAFLVGKTEVVPDANAVARLLSPGFDVRTVAALPAPLPLGRGPQPDPRGQVAWAKRSANEQTLGIVVDRPALLVVTDNFYKAWHAELDGRPVPLLRADYTFRAVPVPAGSHIIRFYYRSGLLNLSVWLSVVLQVLLLVVALGGSLLGRRRRAATPASAGAAA